jgi:hypothetical protein
MLNDLLPYKSVEEIPFDVIADKLKKKLSYDYKLLTLESINKLKNGTSIVFISNKTNTYCKKATFISFSDEYDYILKLMYYKKYIYISLEDNTIFYRYRKTNEFRRSLENLINNDFQVIKLDNIK